MEFRDYLYLDKDRINKYYKQIGGIIPDIDKEIVEKNVKLIIYLNRNTINIVKSNYKGECL